MLTGFALPYPEVDAASRFGSSSHGLIPRPESEALTLTTICHRKLNNKQLRKNLMAVKLIKQKLNEASVYKQ